MLKGSVMLPMELMLRPVKLTKVLFEVRFHRVEYPSGQKASLKRMLASFPVLIRIHLMVQWLISRVTTNEVSSSLLLFLFRVFFPLLMEMTLITFYSFAFDCYCWLVFLWRYSLSPFFLFSYMHFVH